MRVSKVGDAYIEITGRCNFRCVHCYNDSTASCEIIIPLGKHKELADSLRTLEAVSVSLSGGEPFLHPCFEDVVELYADWFKVTVVTNGSLIERNARLVPRHKALGVRYQVSLDGWDAKSFRAIRGVDAFNDVVGGIRLLVESGVEVGVNCVLTRQTYKQYERMIELCQELRVALTFSSMNLTGRAEANIGYFVDEAEILSTVRDDAKRRKYFGKFRCPTDAHFWSRVTQRRRFGLLQMVMYFLASIFGSLSLAWVMCTSAPSLR